MKFYRLVSAYQPTSDFIGYISQTRTHEHNRRQMVLLTFTTEEGRKQFSTAWFYMDDLREVEEVPIEKASG